jgi:biotin transport system substrate-specific component
MTSQPGAMAPRIPAATLADVAIPALGGAQTAQWARAAILVVGGAGLTALAAQLAWHAPWTTVPYTGQTAAVLLVGTVLGSRLGLASMALYVFAGAIGLGVFSGGSSGLYDASGALSGSVGYLAGFIVAAALVGRLAERRWDRSPIRAAGLMVLGNLVIYVIGVPVLAWTLGMSAGDAVFYGAIVFVPWDAFKVVVAAGLLPLAWRAVGSGGARS